MFLDRPAKERPDPSAGLLPQLGMMIRALLDSPVRGQLFILGGAVFAVIVATAYGQIRLNRWNQPFYDALAHRDFRQFLIQLGVFGIITFSLLVLNVGQRWLSEMLKLKLREGLVRDLVGEWLKPGRAARLAQEGAIGVNPDQRMHEDARHLTELSGDLGVQLLQSSILLVTFVEVLWVLSRGFIFHCHGHVFSIPGYMVWAAILYAGTGSLLSYWVGGSLIPKNAERYQRESELRYSLMQVNQHLPAIATPAGEEEARQRLDRDLDAVLVAMRQAGHRPHQSHLGDGRLWLADPGGADPGGGAGLFRRRSQFRRHDDGGGRLQPGAILAALVRGQFLHHRRLARHPACASPISAAP